MSEPITATLGEYIDHGSYVWVDYGDGEELARSLEEVGIKVIRVHEPVRKLNKKNRTNNATPKRI